MAVGSLSWSFPKEVVRKGDLLGEDPGSYLRFDQLAAIYELKQLTALTHFIPKVFPRVLELGVRAGYSAEAFLAAGANMYIGIDAEEPTFWGTTGIVRPAMTALRRRWPGRTIDWIISNSHDQFSRSFADSYGPFDLIHFDGDQSFGGMLRDLVDYTPMLSPGGLVIIDAPCPTSRTDDAVSAFLENDKWTCTRGRLPFTDTAYGQDYILRRKRS